jgi:hypothetical protein
VGASTLAFNKPVQGLPLSEFKKKEIKVTNQNMKQV